MNVNSGFKQRNSSVIVCCFTNVGIICCIELSYSCLNAIDSMVSACNSLSMVIFSSIIQIIIADVVH